MSEPTTEARTQTDAGTQDPAVAMPDLPPGYVAKDYVDGPSCDALHNLTLEYSYTIGNHYRLMFDGDFGISFQMLNDGSEARGPLPYRCRELRPNQYLVHWLVRQFGIHVSVVIDLDNSTICAGAMMPPGSWEFFDIARDLVVTRNA